MGHSSSNDDRRPPAEARYSGAFAQLDLRREGARSFHPACQERRPAAVMAIRAGTTGDNPVMHRDKSLAEILCRPCTRPCASKGSNHLAQTARLTRSRGGSG